MAAPKAVLREQLKHLSKSELLEMLLKLAGKRYNYEYLLVNFLDPDGGELTLFDEALADIQIIWDKEFKGRTVQHQLAKRLNACIKRIKEFTVETKSKKLEADLILYVLQLQFEQPSTVFGARYSGYDYKVALLLKKLISLVTTKIHPDYLLDYENAINEFLSNIHRSSNRIQTVANLPSAIG